MAVGEPNGQRTPARARRAGRAGMAGLLGLSLLATACGDDGDGDEDTLAGAGSTSSSTAPGDGLPSCDAVNHAVVFGIFGTVTLGDADEPARWALEPELEPEARPGAADVVRAYRDLGYEVLYVTSERGDTQIGDQPLTDAVTVWLGSNRFPIDDGTEVWTWDGDRDVSTALIEDLALMSSAGVGIDAGYASDPDVVFPLATSGIPRDYVFAVGEAASDETVTSLPDADMDAHLADVRDRDPICE